MTHYYTNNIDLKSQKTQISFQYRGHHLVFISDSGVFSKERIDYGSRVLLESMNIQSHQKTLLDVGCGYGTLGISLKKVYPWLHVEMVDVNERAIALANESIEHNQENDIIAYKSSVYENVKDTFDIIVSNPPIRAGKKIVFEILEKAYDHLNNQGELFIVIQKKQGAESMLKLLIQIYQKVEIVEKDKGYWIIKAKK